MLMDFRCDIINFSSEKFHGFQKNDYKFNDYKNNHYAILQPAGRALT